jgi:hypothetical protein
MMKKLPTECCPRERVRERGGGGTVGGGGGGEGKNNPVEAWVGGCVCAGFGLCYLLLIIIVIYY